MLNQRVPKIPFITSMRKSNEMGMENSATLAIGTTSAFMEMLRFSLSQRKWNPLWMVSQHAVPFDVHWQFPAGLIGHLKAVSPPMHRLYVAMREQSLDQIAVDEIAVASGKKNLDSQALSDLLPKVESTSMTIQRAFEKQVNAAAVSLYFFN